MGPEFFIPVRELLQRWLDTVPPAARADVAGNLASADDDRFDGAFWELYLHQMLTSSGVDVELHPAVPGTSKQPDFLVHAGQPFYLEAVRVGIPDEARSGERRLNDLEAILDRARVDGWTLSCERHRVGAQAVKSTRLERRLIEWVNALGPAEHALARLNQEQDGDFARLPVFYFDEAGWKLDFTALPVGVDNAPLVIARGSGRAGGSNNQARLARTLSKKARRYGDDLPHPLVTAVLSNTDYPTRPHEVQSALFGEHWLSPARVTNFAELSTDGHWRTTRGWRRSHNPYVVVGSGINLLTMHRRVPWLWRTLEPSVSAELDLPWAVPMDATVPEPENPDARPDLAALGISKDWCAGDPGFDERK